MSSLTRIRSGAALLVACGILAPAPAAQALILTPPGHAGTTQYFENVPTSSGDAAPPGSPGSAPAPHSATQSPLSTLGRGSTGARNLSRLGADGRAAATLAATTAPSPSRAATASPGSQTPAVRGRGATGPRASAPVTSDPGGSAVGGLVTTLTGTDSGGLGLLLPLALLLSVLAALAVGVRRARRPGNDAPAGG